MAEDRFDPERIPPHPPDVDYDVTVAVILAELASAADQLEAMADTANAAILFRAEARRANAARLRAVLVELQQSLLA